MVILPWLLGMRTLVQQAFSHLQKYCQKILSIVMTTSIEPLTCIPRYGAFFIRSDDYIILKLSFYNLNHNRDLLFEMKKVSFLLVSFIGYFKRQWL